jgi:hypothetical protein
MPGRRDHFPPWLVAGVQGNIPSGGHPPEGKESNQWQVVMDSDRLQWLTFGSRACSLLGEILHFKIGVCCIQGEVRESRLKVTTTVL